MTTKIKQNENISTSPIAVFKSCFSSSSGSQQTVLLLAFQYSILPLKVMLCWTFHTLRKGRIQRGGQSQHQSAGEAQTEEVFVALCDLTGGGVNFEM